VVEAVVRDAPAPVPVVAAPPAPVLESASAPAAAEAPAVSRAVYMSPVDVVSGERERLPEELDLDDPIETVIAEYAVPPSISQEEFIEIAKDRILELMREELMIESERNGTLSFDDSLPLS
jgi:hypothetical protein